MTTRITGQDAIARTNNAVTPATQAETAKRFEDAREERARLSNELKAARLEERRAKRAVESKKVTEKPVPEKDVIKVMPDDKEDVNDETVKEVVVNNADLNPLTVAKLRMIAAIAGVWNAELTLVGWRKGLDSTAQAITDFIVEELNDERVNAAMGSRLKGIQSGVDFIVQGMCSMSWLKEMGWAANMVKAKEAMKEVIAGPQDPEAVKALRVAIGVGLGSFAGSLMSSAQLREKVNVNRIGDEKFIMTVAQFIANKKASVLDV